MRVEDLASQLGEIQGNILPGFNKDHQAFVFLSFGDLSLARQWLAEIVDDVATADEVARFNELFKRVNHRRHGREGVVEATWLNIAFTHQGLERLEAPDVAAFPADFREGPARRAREIGDRGASAPDHWIEPFRTSSERGELHALLLLASDSKDRLDRDIVRRTGDAVGFGVRVLYLQEGQVRTDLPGHEHFGFKDGVSQPGVKGYTQSRPSNPAEGDPGQDLVFPGEFVLGYPRMRRVHAPLRSGSFPTCPAAAGEANFEHPGDVARNGPEWADNGSYLVFRRLRQDVPAFRRLTAERARRQGICAELAGAKIVGRYPSGAPLERIKNPPSTIDTQAADPSIADPSYLGRERINDFEFGADADGTIVPRAAHIRKTYPRDEATPTGGEADTQTHRLLRRGVPFGESYDLSTANGRIDDAFPNDRGLLFLCYQTSIADQFEFIQRNWVNDADFPQPGDGVDPVISQTPASPLVTTTCSAYLFQPSIGALALLAGSYSRSHL